jgi:GDP-4-dehydro-6-deoxy-D-mannose reductase
VRAVVIGADGFVGRHLVEHLRTRGDEVTEVVGPRSATAHLAAIALDVRDAEAVLAQAETWHADAVYHLAAVSYGPDAAADPRGALATTLGGTLNILEAAATLTEPPVVFIPGSSEVYGAPNLDRIPESTPLRPINVYGATKAAQEMLALAYGVARGLRVVCSRSFNHIGPGQRESFVLPAFARQLRQIGSGGAEPRLHVGNLSPIRDFTDVRDVVAAYRLLVAADHSGDPVNVASGRGISVGELLDELIAVSGLDVAVETDPARVRAHDPPRVVGDPSRLHEITGWSPHISLAQTVADVWADAELRFA